VILKPVLSCARRSLGRALLRLLIDSGNQARARNREVVGDVEVSERRRVLEDAVSAIVNRYSPAGSVISFAPRARWSHHGGSQAAMASVDAHSPSRARCDESIVVSTVKPAGTLEFAAGART